MLRILTALMIVGLTANVGQAQTLTDSMVSGLQQLNQPIVQSTPGLPTASPMYFLFPRISGALSYSSSGGVATGDGRRYLIGTLFPRLGNGLGTYQNPPQSFGGAFQSGLSMTLPRVGVLSQFLTSPRLGN